MMMESQFKRRKEHHISLVQMILIKGYAGYVHSIKSENIHASTFGKITYDVNNSNYVKGQDLAAKNKYVSTQTSTNIPPSEMFAKTAANIVGIPNKEIKVKEVFFAIN